MKRTLVLLAAGMLVMGVNVLADEHDEEEFNDPDGAIGVLINGTEDAREHAAEYLGDIRHGEATKHLIKALNDVSEDVREEAAQSLGKIQAREAVDPLIVKLSEGDGGVRAAAAEALANIGDPKAIEPMKRQLEAEKNPVTQFRIRNALQQLEATAAIKK